MLNTYVNIHHHKDRSYRTFKRYFLSKLLSLRDNSIPCVTKVIATSHGKVLVIELHSVDFPPTRPYTTFLFL